MLQILISLLAVIMPELPNCRDEWPSKADGRCSAYSEGGLVKSAPAAAHSQDLATKGTSNVAEAGFYLV